MKRELIGKATKSKCTLQSLLELCGMRGTKATLKHVHSEMTVISCTHLMLVSAPPTPFLKFTCIITVLLWKYLYMR